jgi:hypothetical protein
MCQPTLRFDRDFVTGGSGSVSVCGLDQDVLALCSSAGDLLKLVFQVSLAQETSPKIDGLPNVSGRYVVSKDELWFIPHFSFEVGLKYRASFDLRALGGRLHPRPPLTLDFVIPSEDNPPELAEVANIFPLSDLLPENLLRFYVCFSNAMQRGRALKEISLLDSDGQPVADALYRPPVELWDKTMRHLTVLLDPGRLKRWVGPNVALGPPLKAGQEFVLEIRSGMIDAYGRALRKPYRKLFRVSSAIRSHISLSQWEIHAPAVTTGQPLRLTFANPLDWALLLRAITIHSEYGSAVDGRVVVDESEKRWSFTPSAPWAPGLYSIRVEPSLEDVCGNSITGAFDRPLRRDPRPASEKSDSMLSFRLV